MIPLIPTDRFPASTSVTLAKRLRTDQVVREIPESSADRDFAVPRERDLPTDEDPTWFAFLLVVALAVLGLLFIWLNGP